VVAFWGVVAALALLQRWVNPFRPGAALPEVLFGLDAVALANIGIYAVWALLTLPIFRLAHTLPLRHPAWRRRLLMHFGIALGVTITLEGIKYAVIAALLSAIELPTPSGASAPSFGPLTFVLRLWFLDELVIYLTILAVGFVRHGFVRFRQREREATALQTEATSLRAQLADARLSALRMQINPHFLFNTLHSISSLADENPAGVQRIVARLSALLRRALEGTSNQEVPLAKELSFIRDYLEIQRIRFDERLEVVERVDENLQDALVPDLILQPLVENAIKHGATAANGHAARIVLAARRDTDTGRLILVVRDNGLGLDKHAEERAADEGRVGLANTRKRLDALYGTEAGLDLTNASEGGLVATVTLPYHTAADLRATPQP
jgi:two-component sensor histidine kinase